MLIGGFPIEDDATVEEFVSRLDWLPSGFNGRTAQPQLGDPFKPFDQSKLYRSSGQKALEQFEKNRKDVCLTDAIELFEKALDISRKEQNKIAEAFILNDYSQACQFAENWPEALNATQQAVEIYREGNFTQNLYWALGHTYYLNVRMLDKEMGSIGKIYSDLRDLRTNLAEMIDCQKGEQVHYDAYRVEQGEMAISDNELLGTDNFHACICVIAHNPQTLKTVLAHMDHGSDLSTLKEVFDEIAPDNGETLKLRIAGARFGETVSKKSSKKPGYVINSEENVRALFDFLKGQNVNIISAEIFNQTQPTSIVVDPKTFEISEQSPGRKFLDTRLVKARVSVGSQEDPLELAFDLTQSKERDPLFLSAKNIMHLRQSYGSRVETKIFKKRIEKFHSSQAAVITHEMLNLWEEYEKQLSKISKAVEERMKHFEEAENYEVSDRERARIQKAIESIAMGIGAYADVANEPIYNFIENDLFYSHKRGRHEVRYTLLRELNVEDIYRTSNPRHSVIGTKNQFAPMVA